MADSNCYVVGNWKMNGSLSLIHEFRESLLSIKQQMLDSNTKVIICPPAPFLTQCCKEFEDLPVSVGAQDCHSQENGAYTGDISAGMLAEVGAEAVLLGHSERREAHNESSALIAEKFARVRAEGIEPIICVGENEEQYNNNQTAVVVCKQVSRSVPSATSAAPGNWMLAYEPVWSIGSGKIPTEEEVTKTIDILRETVESMRDKQDDPPLRILYGGSVNVGNVDAILSFDGVDGLLVGGASLNPDAFKQIILSSMKR